MRLVKPMQELFEQTSILLDEDEEILRFSAAEELASLTRKVRLHSVLSVIALVATC